MNYVFLKAKIYESKNVDDMQLLSIECIKTDKNLNKIDEYKNRKIGLNDQEELFVINELQKFMKGCRVIGYDLSKILIALLTGMYRWQEYELSFKYFDIKESGVEVTSIDTINDMIHYMRGYSDGNLDNVKYQRKTAKGYQLLKVFRGLDYKLYLLNKGYYMYDKSSDRYLSFYVHRKELANEWDYTEDEYMMLKKFGANFVTNFMYLSDETIKITNEYTIYSSHNLDRYNYMIQDLKRSLQYLENHPDLDIKLVCIGTIEELKENYQVLGKENLDKILSLITREKELWSNW